MNQPKKNRNTRRNTFRVNMRINGIKSTITPANIPEDMWTHHSGEWDGQTVNSIYSITPKGGDKTIIKFSNGGKTQYFAAPTLDLKVFGQQISSN